MSTDHDSKRSKRRYESPRRREQARATRERIAVAARRLFVESGWAGTRISDVAREAGVSEPTVYAAYGSKAGLAVALVDSVDLSADVRRMMAELDEAEGDPVGQISAIVGFDRRLFERNGAMIAVMREGGRSEPELAAAYADGRSRGDRIRQRAFASWPEGSLREGMDRAAAADTFAALCNLDVYRLLISERGWTPEQVETWWRESLVRLLLR